MKIQFYLNAIKLAWRYLASVSMSDVDIPHVLSVLPLR